MMLSEEGVREELWWDRKVPIHELSAFVLFHLRGLLLSSTKASRFLLLFQLAQISWAEPLDASRAGTCSPCPQHPSIPGLPWLPASENCPLKWDTPGLSLSQKRHHRCPSMASTYPLKWHVCLLVGHPGYPGHPSVRPVFCPPAEPFVSAQ